MYQRGHPPSLLQSVGMVEHGADINSHLRFGTSQTAEAIVQLLQYNCFSWYKEGAAVHRHSKDRETPFPVYIGVSVFAKTRKRSLVEMLHEHGMSISYDRVLEISAQLGDATVSKFVEEGVVCPPVLRKGLFTTSVMDNIDHNPSATTATTSFLGTSVSVFQHPTKESSDEERRQLRFGPERVKCVPELPDSFTNIHIEMAALKSIGTLLQGSGWTGALVEAGVVSSGTAESILSVASVTRTRQMHQVTCSM